MTPAPGWPAVLLVGLFGLVAVRGVGAADSKPPRPDAELLLDLDLLREADLAREKGLLTRMRMLERMRVLESLPALEAAPQAARPAPAKEVK